MEIKLLYLPTMGAILLASFNFFLISLKMWLYFIFLYMKHFLSTTENWKSFGHHIFHLCALGLLTNMILCKGTENDVFLLQYMHSKSTFSHWKVCNILDTSRGCTSNEGRDKGLRGVLIRVIIVQVVAALRKSIK